MDVIAPGADVETVPGSTLALNLDLEVESVDISNEFIQYVDNELEFSGIKKGKELNFESPPPKN